MIELSEQEGKLASYNPRPELHGQDPKPAADLVFAFNAASADFLPMLDPVLRGFLFHKNGAVTHDLANATHDAPDLRFPKLKGPIKWALNVDGELTIHRGLGGISDIVMPAKLKKPLAIDPQTGGTVIVTLQAQCHPDEKQAGAIYMLMGEKISVSFVPESEGPDDEGGDE